MGTNYWALYGDRYEMYLKYFPGKTVDNIRAKLDEIMPDRMRQMKIEEQNSTGLFWTIEEDAKLMMLWPVFKKHWDKYVAEFPGRSKVAIRQHLKILLEKQQQINLGTVISVLVGEIWKDGMLTKIWDGQCEGMVSMYCDR